METKIELNLEDIKKIIETKLPEWFTDKLSSNYDNPLKDAVDEAIKSQEGIIKNLVNEVLENVIGNEEFKKEIGKTIISRVIAKGLN